MGPSPNPVKIFWDLPFELELPILPAQPPSLVPLFRRQPDGPPTATQLRLLDPIPNRLLRGLKLAGK